MLRWFLTALAALILLAGVALGVLRLRFHGPALADTVANVLNSSIRGHVEVDSIEWPLGAIPRVVAGGWIPVTIRGLRVYDDGGMQGEEVDDDRRELVIRAPLATGYIDAHSLIFGNNDLVIKNLRIPDGGYVLLRQVPEPYPLHAYDHSVVSLASAFYPRLKLGFRAGLTATSSSIFDIRDFDIRGVTLELIYPGVHLRAEGVNAAGFLHSDYSDPLKDKVFFSLSPTAERGLLRVGDLDGGRKGDLARGDIGTIYDIPLDSLHIERLSQLPLAWPRDMVAHDVTWKVRARTQHGSRLSIEGGLFDYWVGYYGGDLDLTLTVEDGGPLVELLSDTLAGGKDLRLQVKVAGPSLGPRVMASVYGLDVRVPFSASEPPLDLHLASATASFDLVTEQGSLEDTVAQGAGGEVHVSATFGLAPFQFDLRADITRSILVGPYLPAQVRQLAGDRLRGRLHVFGDGERQKLDTLDLWLGRAHVTGELVADKDRTLHANRVRVRVGETEVTSSGVIDVLQGTFNLGVSARSTDLPRWLRALDVPALATGLSGTAQLSGSMDDPRARASIRLSGVELLRELQLNLGYANQVVSINEASSRALGGSLWARGRVRVGPAVRVLDLDAQARDLDLGRIPVLGSAVGGRMDVAASATGPIDRLRANLATNLDELTIAGDRYSFAAMEPCPQPTRRGSPKRDLAARDPDTWKGVQLCTHTDGTRELSFEVERAGGGTLGTRATLSAAGELGGTLAMSALPLQQISALGGVQHSPVGGLLSTSLALSGQPSAPEVTGTVNWLGGWFERAFLGAGTLEVVPLGPGLIGLQGTLLQGDVRVSARLRTEAPYDSQLQVELRRVELDRFVPELARQHKIRGWITGTIEADMPLAPVPGRPPQVTARLTEAELWLDNEDSHGRPAPIRVRNQKASPIALHFDGTTLRLLEEVTLVGPGGAAFQLAGKGHERELDIRLSGNVAVEMVQPYVREHIDAMSGTVAMQLSVRGPLADPMISMDVEIVEPVAVRPAGQEAQISLAKGGLINITNNQITPTGLFVIVEDPYTGERAALKIGGGVQLEDFTPKWLGLIIEGELSGKLLVVLAPEVFSRAGGVAQLEVVIRGDPSDPKPYGEIVFQNARPLSLTPRGLRREIRLTSGEISFLGDDIELSGIQGTIDDEGIIRTIDGDITLENRQPVSLDLVVSADSLPFRIPRTLDLTVNIDRMRLVGNIDQGLDIGGVIEVVDGRYVRNFNLITEALTPERSDDADEPFYESVPLLADARLGLTLDTRGFFVQNNLATIQLIGELQISGTPREPKLSGDIRVEQGTFKLPGVRAKFTRTRGSVSFSEFKPFPGDTPELDVQSESDYRDPSGQEHLVTLTIKGPLSNLNWDLVTSSGLNKGQTVTMLLSGRTPEEFRKTLGDDAPGRDPTRVDPSTAPSENVADQLLKDLAGDFISLLIEDKLRNLTTLDVARLEIGTGSIGFHGEKELFKNLRFLGDLEQTLRGRTMDMRGQYRLSDRLAIEGEYLNKNFDDDSEQDISDLRLRAVMRYFWP